MEVGARTWVTLSAHVDRFLGGRAAAAIGPVTIDASPWNGAARLFAERRIGGGGAVTLAVDRLWPGRGETSVKAGYAVRFRGAGAIRRDRAGGRPAKTAATCGE